MSTIRSLLLIAVISMMGITACNYTVGECWPVGQGGGSGSVAAGGGVIVPTGPAGSGDYGDAPPKQPQDATNPEGKIKCNSDEEDTEAESECNAGDAAANAESLTVCSDACTGKCGTGVNAGPFNSSIFKFVTIVADDGKDEAGGWQEAAANLRIVRLGIILPEIWSCPVTIGMPLRTTVLKAIPPSLAASITTKIANEAAMKVRNEEPNLPQGIFCLRIYTHMKSFFVRDFPALGARVN